MGGVETERALNLMELSEGKAFPVGTRRIWKGIVYRKTKHGSWLAEKPRGAFRQFFHTHVEPADLGAEHTADNWSYARDPKAPRDKNDYKAIEKKHPNMKALLKDLKRSAEYKDWLFKVLGKTRLGSVP